MDSLALGLEALFKMGALVLAAGAVILVHDSIIGERQQGVTEWLLSKPVSRPSYVLSKLVAHGLGVLVILSDVGNERLFGHLGCRSERWSSAGGRRRKRVRRSRYSVKSASTLRSCIDQMRGFLIRLYPQLW